MNTRSLFNVPGIVCSLTFVMLLAYPLTGQQKASLPVITLVSPSSSDSLNNTGVITVRAEIVSAVPLLSFRIINNSETIVNESGMKPEKKDENTYVISSFVPLRRGINNISVEAKNTGGMAYSDIRTVNSHLEPFITWLNPAADNIDFESGIVTLQVEIRSPYQLLDLTVNVNGTESTRENAGVKPAGDNVYTFEKRIQLKPGKNVVYFSADNGKGITRSVVRSINFGAPPVITITSPLPEDSINNSGLVTLIAQIKSGSPLQSFRIFHNNTSVLDEKGTTPEKKDSSTFILGSNLPLRKGLNTIYIEARNSLGTSASEKRIINSHSEPFVTWLVPEADNFISKSGSMAVRAEIRTIFPLQNLKINVNGSYLTADEKSLIKPVSNGIYSFEKAVQLKPGRNSLYITADNTKGAIRSVTRIVNFGTAPLIKVLSPSSADSLNNSGVSLVRAELTSYTPLQSFRIMCNGIPAVDETMAKPEQKDSVTYLIGTNVPLKKGINIISIEAKNMLGTSASGEHTVVSQSEPFVTWLSPAYVSSETESGTVNIRAEIRSLLDLQNVRLSLNGIIYSPEDGELTRVDNGLYMFEKSLRDALTSKNTLFITAANVRGTTTSDTRTVYYSSGSKPVITITSADSLNNSGIILFSAEIVSQTKLQAIRVVQNGNILVNESSKIPDQKDSITYELRSLIPLKAGLNTFYIEAKNTFGTGSSLKYNITCQPEPIINWISPSTPVSSDGTGALKLKAEIITSFDLVNAGVNLNGIPVAEGKEGLTRVANDKYVLEHAITLQEGDNTLFLTASNARGTGTSSKRNISYIPAAIPDNKPVTQIKEEVSIAEQKPGETVKPPETVVAKQEITPAETITPAVPDKKEEALPSVAPAEAAVVPPAPPAAPAITWLSPSRERTDVSLSSAKIRATIKSDVNPQSLLVYVNGVASEDLNLLSAAVSGGEYTLEKSIMLRPGENNIYLIATNSSGTTRSETRYLTNPPANPPTISWSIPSIPNTIVNSEVVIVEACVKSATELKEVKILVNGVQQSSDMMFQAPLPGDCNYRIAKSVILKDGDNSIYIIADNYAGSITSDKRVIRFQTGMAEKRLALVIGNSNYGNSMVLRNPVNDANLIEGTLKSLGFEVIKRLDATKNVMMEAVRDFSKKLTEYNVALFYYAGHGVQVDGENYLVPTDAQLNEQTDCKWEAVPVNFIVEEFEKVPDNVNIVILDACRNNPFKSWARGGAEGFRALNAVTGTIVGYATSENSTAADGSGANGTYTEELVKQMVVPQSISNVFINTRRQVLQRTNNSQRPQEWNMLTGDFYFKK